MIVSKDLMYKFFRYFIVFLCFQQNTAQAMDSIKKATIAEGVIKGATHYHLIQGGKTMVWDRTPSQLKL